MVVPLRRRQAASEVESVVSTLPHPSPEAVQRLLTVTSTVLESAIQAGVDDLDTDSLPCDVLELLSECLSYWIHVAEREGGATIAASHGVVVELAPTYGLVVVV